MIEQNDPKVFAVLPLRDVVVFPYMILPLFVGRKISIKAIEVALAKNKQILLLAQKDSSIDNPGKNELFNVGTIASILQILKLPDGTVKVLVEGVKRAKAVRITENKDGYFQAEIQAMKDTGGKSSGETEVIARSLIAQFEQYAKLNQKIPLDLISTLQNLDDYSRIADTIAAQLPLKLEDKQKLHEIANHKDRLEQLMVNIETEMELLNTEKRLRQQVKKQMDQNHKEYFLNEKMKAIQKELGNAEGAELEELEERIRDAGMSEEAEQKVNSEVSKLKMMPPMSAEATVVRNYLDTILNLPWSKSSKLSSDLKKAQEILDADHYGLEKVKERIIEYLAVQQRVGKSKGPVLCLVGPPGVGKTSLGQSIANAVSRKFVRMSLGGVRDEAEIRGHRRTYIGSMPGKILQKISKTKVRNPLFLLDEIDKMAMDFRGDPAAALLEVLDPEQNDTFNDHYLEVDFDLSDVMFIATANSMEIPVPLLDRMEIIRIPGYTEDEKIHIAMQYLIPKQFENNGVKASELNITKTAVQDIIRYYTRESGVRSLEREIAKICRKVIQAILTKKAKKKISVTKRNLEEYLGVQRYRYGVVDKEDRVGIVTGLAWTQVGGEILRIEAAVVKGTGKANCTGSLGDVMQESIQAATTVVRQRALSLGIAHDNFKNKDIHVHVPEGATPKDGPSAGIGMCTALISALTHIPVRRDVAMTGEITLRGEVLPIGGLKEKLLAAHRGKITCVIIPAENERDLKDIPQNVLDDLDIHPVRWIDEVIELALVSLPEAISEEDEVLAETVKTSKQRARIKKSSSEKRAH